MRIEITRWDRRVLFWIFRAVGRRCGLTCSQYAQDTRTGTPMVMLFTRSKDLERSFLEHHASVMREARVAKHFPSRRPVTSPAPLPHMFVGRRPTSWN